MFPDRVTITPVTRNATFRTETRGTSFNSDATVEEDSEIRYSSSGAPVDPEIWIFLPADTLISKGDFIEIIKLHGQDPTTDEAEERKVKRTHRAGGFTISHIEVLV